MDLRQNTSQKTKPKFFDVDDFEIEDIPFKPITDGLGFNNKYDDFKKTRSNTQQVHQRVQKKVYEQMSNTEVQKEVPAELEAFYSAPTQSGPKVNRNIDLKVKIERDANLVARLLSWVVDTLICSVIFGTIFGIMFVATSMSVMAFTQMILSDYNIAFPIILFVLVYNIYGISMGYQQTVGQKLLRVKNKFEEIKAEPASFLIKRSYFEIFSLLLLGLPYLLKYDDKVLGNKVIKA
ncbi:RDD family protein [Bacteriovorax sp. DB6_IX]|uniref:RDD family protein n=1 Tax=Bacteriovorax sp. DB6_IX TaxID=1353530 RepID=UPI00038A2A0C|nr:RDD family protein [Bacteriovorax sp. DB6_IX]EQC51342.1 RDD domain protein [Bacteriovorax sp. DB6_IX]